MIFPKLSRPRVTSFCTETVAWDEDGAQRRRAGEDLGERAQELAFIRLSSHSKVWRLRMRTAGMVSLT